ncbi:hypothetical protein AB1Y20_015492 [Prymnesium parvum]|uniref:Dolichol kinase n=1 Tax=Prymnesium parvum TaxID=97485 RepID=A0AB34K0L8_PRYPA
MRWRGLALIHLVGAAPLHDVAATLLPANHSSTAAASLTLLVSSTHAQLQPSHAVDTHLEEPSQGSPLHSLLAHAPTRDTPNRGVRKVYIVLIVASMLLTLFSIWHYNFAWPWPSTPHLQLQSARLPSVKVPSLQLTSLGDCIRAASMVAILIAAGAIFVQAPLQVRDGGPWNSPHHECTVTYHGVICVDPAQERVGDAVYLSQPLDWTIYAGAVAFALLTLLTMLIHWWRKSMPMPLTQLQFSPSFAEAYVPHVGPQLRTLLTDPCSLAKIIWLDWLHPAITGALIGLAMGAYQLVLQCLISAVWGNKGVTSGEPPYQHLSPWAVALLPPLLLGLTGWLQARLRAGAAGNFVQAVVNDLHIELFRGLVVTTVVSLLAIVSGGSAGPEGPVLFMGAAIAIATRPLHQIFYDGSVNKPGGMRERWLLRWDPRFKGRPMGDDALIGGCAAIAAFFDHPVSGCLLVMELPTMHGSLRRGEVLPSALVASTLSWATHRALMNAGDIPPPPLLPSVCPSIGHLLLAVPLGLVAGGLSLCFVHARRLLDSLPFRPAMRGVAWWG